MHSNTSPHPDSRYRQDASETRQRQRCRPLRNIDYSDRYQQHFTLGSDISTRDRDGIHKTFSGLMKLIYPGGEATQEEIEELLRFAVEGRDVDPRRC